MKLRLNKMLPEFGPTERLKIEVREYKEGKFELKFLINKLEYGSERLAGCIVLDKTYAYQITEALRGIDKSFNIIVDGRVEI
jgi:hypothetical protein